MLFHAVGGQQCTDFVDIGQNGNNHIGRDRLGIIPRLNFTCDGRITGIMARVRRFNRDNYLYFNVWRLSSTTSMVYTNTGEVQLQESQVSQCNSDGYCNVSIVLTGNDRIEFQSGDVVGYYHPSDARYQVRNLMTDGYVLYRIDGSLTSTADLNNVRGNRIINQQQPLIQFVIGNVHYIPSKNSIVRLQYSRIK